MHHRDRGAATHDDGELGAPGIDHCRDCPSTHHHIDYGELLMSDATTYPGTVEVVTFTVAEGDPGGTITITVRDPALVATSYVLGTDPEITNPDVGVYTIDVPCPISGTWAARFTAVGGTYEGADEITWGVLPSRFALT
jgi:hypothetical protein